MRFFHFALIETEVDIDIFAPCVDRSDYEMAIKETKRDVVISITHNIKAVIHTNTPLTEWDKHTAKEVKAFLAAFAAGVIISGDGGAYETDGRDIRLR